MLNFYLTFDLVKFLIHIFGLTIDLVQISPLKRPILHVIVATTGGCFLILIYLAGSCHGPYLHTGPYCEMPNISTP